MSKYRITDQLVKCPICRYHHYWMEEDVPKLETLNIEDGIPETEEKRKHDKREKNSTHETRG